jgi:hypothetical protein
LSTRRLYIFEGYEIPVDKYVKFESWFNKWASRIHVPLLLEVPGLKAISFYRLFDFKDPRYDDVRLIELEMPRFISITYLQDNSLAGNFNQSVKLAACRRNMELEFGYSLKTVWNTEYQLVSSRRP